MIHLRLLGPLELDDPGSALLFKQPKRLALLGYLALAGGQSLVRRDKVLAVFWPELPLDRARHSLNQSLHFLRSLLPPDTILSRGDGLGVDASQLGCDASEFLRLLEAGNREGALALYRGPLLDGFYLEDAGGFEQWLEETRSIFLTKAVAAAAALSRDASASGTPDAAVLWARRETGLAPLDERAAQRLISALDRAGDRSGALQAYQRIEQRLRSELEVPPAPETRELVDQIRARQSAESSPQPRNGFHEPPSRPRRRSTRTLAAAGLAVLVAAIAGWNLLGDAAVPAPDRAAVLPFVVDGNPDSAGMADLLGDRLDGAGSLSVVPPDSAGSLIEGRLTRTGATAHLSATWKRRSGSDPLIANVSVEGPGDQLPALLDSLALRLLAESQPLPHRRLARAAAQSAPSLAALKAFLEGEQALREGRFLAATHAFEQAAKDSSFVLAQYRLEQAALWASDYPLASTDAGARALRHGATLSEHERRLVSAFDAWRRGDRNLAVSSMLDLTGHERNDAEAWHQLGEAQFHYNPRRGLPTGDAADAFEQVVRIDAGHWGALWHLALLDAMDRDTASLDRRVNRLLELGPDTDYRLEIAALRGCAHRDRAALASITDSLRAARDNRLHDLAWRCAVYGRDLEGARSMAMMLIERRQTGFAQSVGRTLLAHLELAQGHRAAGLAQLDSLATINRLPGLDYRTRASLLPWWRTDNDELERLATAWQSWEPSESDGGVASGWAAERLELLALLSSALGKKGDALGLAARLERLPDPAGTRGVIPAVVRSIRYDLAARNPELGFPPAIDTEGFVAWYGWTVMVPFYSRALDRYQRGEQLAREGRTREALTWYQSLAELSVADFVFAAPAHLRRAELYEQAGDTSSAAVELRRFLDLWGDADGELGPLVQSARDRLGRFRR